MKNTNLLRADEALKLHAKQEKFPKLVTSGVAEVLDDEKTAKKAAEICAKQLESLFMKKKNEDPLKDQFDLYKEPEGREAIQELFRLAKSTDMMKLFGYLNIKLKNLGLKGTMPSFSYFEGKHDGSAYYYIKFLKQDKIKEREINNRSKKCAQNLINLYKDFKLENGGEEIMRMNTRSEGWKNIEDFLDGVSGWDITKMFGHLSDELDAKGYVLKRPSYSYFEGKHDGSAYIYISEKAQDVEKAA